MENNGEIVIFELEDGLAKLNANLKDDNVWLRVSQMAELFDRDRSVISKHMKNIFEGKRVDNRK